MNIAYVQAKRWLKPGYFLLQVEAPWLAQKALPGQFAMLRAWEADDPLLARPFSLHDIEGPKVTFLIQVRGKGTKILSKLSKGDRIRVLGPLGRGFPLPRHEVVYLVAGGIGVAPFLFTAKELLQKGKEVILLYGARGKQDLLRLSAFKRLGLTLYLATEDGSVGRQGLVTTLLEEIASQRKGHIFACGPWPMLAAVARWARGKSFPTHLSLEARMACGLGFCLGCTVKRRSKGYLHVCTEGPVVSAGEIF